MIFGMLPFEQEVIERAVPIGFGALMFAAVLQRI
ncbi:MAG: hypothetical protein USCGTAYLOR_01658 [Chromatiales bacterium USCg_Taylor]|nr:MAG: hypothetical protein USCGTAYLOR_01658 [Chromatiales bacterium USCg_Taylor]